MHLHSSLCGELDKPLALFFDEIDCLSNGEVIARALSSRAQMAMSQKRYPPELPAYVADNRVDMTRLLRDFQRF